MDLRYLPEPIWEGRGSVKDAQTNRPRCLNRIEKFDMVRRWDWRQNQRTDHVTVDIRDEIEIITKLPVNDSAVSVLIPAPPKTVRDWHRVWFSRFPSVYGPIRSFLSAIDLAQTIEFAEMQAPWQFGRPVPTPSTSLAMLGTACTFASANTSPKASHFAKPFIACLQGTKRKDVNILPGQTVHNCVAQPRTSTAGSSGHAW